VRVSWALGAAVILAAGAGAAGCGKSDSSGAPAATAQGSRYWHEGDTLGNPLKTPTASEASLAAQVLDLVNQERAGRGLPTLAWDGEAATAAHAHAEDMAARGFFSHFTPEGWSPGDRLDMLGAAGYSGWAENIAVGQPAAADVMTDWMNSPGHQANILDPDLTHLGVGVVEAPGPQWVQVFLRR